MLMICLFTCTVREAIGRMNEDIIHIERWMIDNGFLLNVSKTQAMIMGTPRYHNVIDYKSLPDVMIGGTVIQFSAHVRSIQ